MSTATADERAIDRALSKSHEQQVERNFPRLLRHSRREMVYTVHSRRAAGDVYRVVITADGEIGCDCPTGVTGGRCWHKLHCLRARSGEIETWTLLEDDLGAALTPAPDPRAADEIDALMLSGKRRAMAEMR